MKLLQILFLVLLFVGCRQGGGGGGQEAVDLDRIANFRHPGSFADAQDTQNIKEFEGNFPGQWSDSLDRICKSQYSYCDLSDTSKCRSLFWEIRSRAQQQERLGDERVFWAAIGVSRAYLENLSWDSAWRYLNIADSFFQPSHNLPSWEGRNMLRSMKSEALENQGQVDDLIRLWGNECIGSDHERLARAFRKKYGKDRMKLEIEKALANPHVTPVPLEMRQSFGLSSKVIELPDGDSIPDRDFGGLYVRLDLLEKSFYLWVPGDRDSLTNVSAYLNHFRETSFCKILQDIDPDARE
ncbi:MAG: hypothetical protein IPO40_03745 [Fibrobacteres bacterium]|nr:hypothetical protein [Fibrobacterota bacterium]